MSVKNTSDWLEGFAHGVIWGVSLGMLGALLMSVWLT